MTRSAIRVIGTSLGCLYLPSLTMPMEQRLKESRAIWQGSHFTEEKFPISQSGGPSYFCAIRFPGHMKLEDIAEWADEEERQVASLAELLAVSALSYNGQEPLFALETTCDLQGHRYAPYIQGTPGSRKLMLRPCSKGWGGGDYILIRGDMPE